MTKRDKNFVFFVCVCFFLTNGTSKVSGSSCNPLTYTYTTKDLGTDRKRGEKGEREDLPKVPYAQWPQRGLNPHLTVWITRPDMEPRGRVSRVGLRNVDKTPLVWTKYTVSVHACSST